MNQRGKINRDYDENKQNSSQGGAESTEKKTAQQTTTLTKSKNEEKKILSTAEKLTTLGRLAFASLSDEIFNKPKEDIYNNKEGKPIIKDPLSLHVDLLTFQIQDNIINAVNPAEEARFWFDVEKKCRELGDHLNSDIILASFGQIDMLVPEELLLEKNSLERLKKTRHKEIVEGLSNNNATKTPPRKMFDDLRQNEMAKDSMTETEETLNITNAHLKLLSENSEEYFSNEKQRLNKIKETFEASNNISDFEKQYKEELTVIEKKEVKTSKEKLENEIKKANAAHERKRVTLKRSRGFAEIYKNLHANVINTLGKENKNPSKIYNQIISRDFPKMEEFQSQFIKKETSNELIKNAASLLTEKMRILSNEKVDIYKNTLEAQLKDIALINTKLKNQPNALDQNEKKAFIACLDSISSQSNIKGLNEEYGEIQQRIKEARTLCNSKTKLNTGKRSQSAIIALNEILALQALKEKKPDEINKLIGSLKDEKMIHDKEKVLKRDTLVHELEKQVKKLRESVVEKKQSPQNSRGQSSINPPTKPIKEEEKKSSITSEIKTSVSKIKSPPPPLSDFQPPPTSTPPVKKISATEDKKIESPTPSDQKESKMFFESAPVEEKTRIAKSSVSNAATNEAPPLMSSTKKREEYEKNKQKTSTSTSILNSLASATTSKKPHVPDLAELKFRAALPSKDSDPRPSSTPTATQPNQNTLSQGNSVRQDNKTLSPPPLVSEAQRNKAQKQTKNESSAADTEPKTPRPGK